MSIRKTISVVVPTYNCSGLLPYCLQSVKWADEIIVVDMCSTDKTVEVVKKFNAKIYTRFPKNGNFDWNREFGMRKAKSDWIMKLDSDEILSLSLQREIKQFLSARDNREFNGFNLYNRLFMFGRQVKHGFVKPRSHELRIVRKNQWIYKPYRYHQQIIVKGKIGFMRNYYDHYNYRTISEFFDKTNKYTDLDSTILLEERKIDLLMVVFAPVKTFFKLFVIQFGFFEGEFGFMVCFLYSLYNFIEKIKMFEKKL